MARPDVALLLFVLMVGTLLRVRLMAHNRPAFLGYPDTGPYLYDALSSLYPFYDPLRVTGYPIFLRQMHDVVANLSVVSLVQHLLGLGTAAALYATARLAGLRCGWIGVLPAAVVSLGGIEIMFEHALISESLWLWLVVMALLCCVAAARPSVRPPAGLGFAVVAGLLIGASVVVRLPSMFAIPPMLLWLAFGGPGGRARRVAGPAVLLAAALLPIYAAASWQQRDTGRFGLSRNGALNLYGRVAPWADCTKFTPPRGTEFLCESTPVRDRFGHEVYVFGKSPALARYGTNNLTTVLPPEGSRALVAWSKAAILGQPFTYATAVLRDSRRIIDPSAAAGMAGQSQAGYGLPPSSYPPLLQDATRDAILARIIAENYGPDATNFVRGDVRWLNAYERATLVRPLLMALLVVLAVMAPLATRGPERRLAWLFTPVALLLLEMPVVTSIYDYRYIVPVLGILALPAAIGAWSVILSTRGWWRARGAPEAPSAHAMAGARTP